MSQQNEQPSFSRIVLATASKFRQDILKQVGLSFIARTAPINEYDYTDSDPVLMAEMRAKEKALAVAALEPEALVIGFDQTLSFEGQVYDKMTSKEDALARLTELSGKTHSLHSAYAFATCSSASASCLEVHTVSVEMVMRELQKDEILAYLSTGEWEGCVGCYQAENLGANLFESIGGDLHTVIGVPTLAILRALRKYSMDPLSQFKN